MSDDRSAHAGLHAQQPQRRRPPAAGSNDAAILARVAAGEVCALATLYDHYAPQLLLFARRIDINDAEDIVQTVFMRVLRIAATFRADAPSARPWLFAITTRVLQERTRGLRRWRTAQMRLADRSSDRSGCDGIECARDMQRALERLSLAKRMVLVLAEVEGFAGEEIAEMLSIPVGTVWTRLHHARKQLRAIVEEA
jgi:RNA polymerase sigma-70 factor (ECF subfamily)